MSIPAKPVANLTKKAYIQLCEHITGNTSPEHAQIVVELMTAAMRDALGFDPSAKSHPELVKRQHEKRKELLEKEGVSNYEKYIKPRYERLKTEYPNVPAHLLVSTPQSKLDTL